jgi:hypothetical protein
MNDKVISRNRALVRFILLPMIFLMVVLLGGLRIDIDTHAFVFFPPRLITLILSVLLMILFVRGHTIELRQWINSEQPLITNVSHALTLLTLYFASVQAFNSVLPEHGFLFWLFSFFFLWTLWNNLFSAFDTRALLRSLMVLFGTVFFLKHMFLASIFSPNPGVVKQIAGFLLDLGTLGTLDYQAFAPATGYICFFTLALYIGGLLLLPPSPEAKEASASALIRAYQNLPAPERTTMREAIMNTYAVSSTDRQEAPVGADTVEITGELIDLPSEETKVSK